MFQPIAPFGHEEGQFERLVGVEPRVAMGVVAVLQVLAGHRARTAGAFGDVLAGHLDVDAAGMGALGAVDRRSCPPRDRMRSNGRVL
jgi:hypothetical protein